MKIFVNARFLTQALSGVQRYAIECSRQIKKLHQDTIFLTPHNVIQTDIAKELGAVVVGRRTGHLWEQVDLPLYLKSRRADVLLNLANTAPLFFSKNYVTLHDLAFYHHPEWNSKAFATWYNFLIPRLAARSKHLFTVSETIKDEIISCYGVTPGKISITYNGISDAMKSVKTTGIKEKIILAVGTFNIRKNHLRLIDAFRKSEVRKDHQLVIIGDKNKVFRETTLDDNILEEFNIKICNDLSERELIDMYQRAECVVSLSLYEGFGIPLLEGIYFDCKVICSDIPVYRELFSAFATFCSPVDLHSIVTALNNIGNLQRPCARSDYKSVFEKYSYEASARTIMNSILK